MGVMIKIIRTIARCVLLLVSIASMFPHRSSPDETLTWRDLLVSAYMCLLTIDMLLLIIGIRRRRLHLLLEFALYGVFIGHLLFAMLISNVYYAQTDGGYTLLVIHFSIIAALIGSAIVVLLDAKQCFQSLRLKGGSGGQSENDRGRNS